MSYMWVNPQFAKRRKRRMRPLAAFVAVLILSCTVALRAQSTNASLTGRVTDPAKALIVDAKVVAINAGLNWCEVFFL